jgi:hypothetical protein
MTERMKPEASKRRLVGYRVMLIADEWGDDEYLDSDGSYWTDPFDAVPPMPRETAVAVREQAESGVGRRKTKLFRVYRSKKGRTE